MKPLFEYVTIYAGVENEISTVVFQPFKNYRASFVFACSCRMLSVFHAASWDITPPVNSKCLHLTTTCKLLFWLRSLYIKLFLPHFWLCFILCRYFKLQSWINLSLDTNVRFEPSFYRMDLDMQRCYSFEKQDERLSLFSKQGRTTKLNFLSSKFLGILQTQLALELMSMGGGVQKQMFFIYLFFITKIAKIDTVLRGTFAARKIYIVPRGCRRPKLRS